MPPYPYRPPSRRRRRALPIGLTPLIDVVFILLVFFMLATSLLHWRSLELNVSARAAGTASMEGALVVEIRRDGVRLSGEEIPTGALATRIGEHLARRPRQRILVKPAPGVTLQEAVQVLDSLTAAGARDVSLVQGAAGERLP